MIDLVKTPYHETACVKLVCALIEQSIVDYKSICRSGWLIAPFELQQGALLRSSKTNKGICVLHDNDSALSLLHFLRGKWLDRILSLANIKLDADRVRSELTKYYNQHSIQ